MLGQPMLLQNAKGIFFPRNHFKTSNRDIKLDVFCILMRMQRNKIQTKALEVNGKITLASADIVSTLIKFSSYSSLY